MKIQFLKLFNVLLFVLSFTVVNAQKSKSKTTALPRYLPRYTYEPPQRDTAASANITISILKPIFLLGEYSGNKEEPYAKFSTSMVNDVEALLTAKGYKVRGPFSSRDEMVYNDKQNSDFTLEIAIDYYAEVQRNWKSSYNILKGTHTYLVNSANVNITAAVVMTAKSNFSGEKLWKKNLDLGLKSFSYEGSVKWQGQDLSFRRELAEDNNFWNPYVKQLEKVYTEALTILWNQFDVYEMKTVAVEAKKERERYNTKGK